jgi:hypothetical protein
MTAPAPAMPQRARPTGSGQAPARRRVLRRSQPAGLIDATQVTASRQDRTATLRQHP